MWVIGIIIIIAFFATVFGSLILEQYQEKSLTHAVTFVLLPVSFVVGLEALLGFGSREPIYGMDHVNCFLACVFVFIGSLAMRWAKNQEFKKAEERECERLEAQRLADYHGKKADLAARAGDDSTYRSEMVWTQCYVARARALETLRPAPKPPRKSLRSWFS